MKLTYLFPNKCKKIGWAILLPSVVLGLFTAFSDFEPSFLDFNFNTFLHGKFNEDFNIFSRHANNLLNEILGILIIFGALLVAFSKEKIEDEFISKIRLESLVWGVYLNYAILLIAIIFIYDLAFIWVMIFNMFTILLFFIMRFHWQIYKLRNSSHYAE